MEVPSVNPDPAIADPVLSAVSHGGDHPLHIRPVSPTNRLRSSFDFSCYYYYRKPRRSNEVVDGEIATTFKILVNTTVVWLPPTVLLVGLYANQGSTM